MKSFKVKYDKSFNGETGVVFTLTFDRLKTLLEEHNDLKVLGFTVRETSIDVFVDTLMASSKSIIVKGKL